MSSGNDAIISIIKKFVFHRSIKLIKKKFKIKSEFSFNHVSKETIKNDKWVWEALKTGSFPGSLKCANVTPIYKKVDPFDKKKFRVVSILPLLLNVYENDIRASVKLFLNLFQWNFVWI